MIGEHTVALAILDMGVAAIVVLGGNKRLAVEEAAYLSGEDAAWKLPLGPWLEGYCSLLMAARC